MSKNQTFEEVNPKGTCMICKQQCYSEAVAHYECALMYLEKKKEYLKENKKE